MPSARSLFGLGLRCTLVASLAACQSLVPAPQPPANARTAPAGLPATGAPAPSASGAAIAANATAPAPAAAAELAAPQPAPRPLHIALALGGGAARGFAHVGVIKALEQRGIHPDIVVGTSVGSFVGSLYAAGYSGAELERVARQFEESTLTDWSSVPARGLFKGEALQDFVNRAVGERPMEQLPRKLAVVATDLGNGNKVVFERGNVGKAVRASSSVPGVYQPVNINGRDYVDGGLVSPVPVETARRLGADIVIAVDVSKLPSNQSTAGAFDILMQTFTIMGEVIARSELADADIVLRPSLGAVGSTDFDAREAAIALGEKAVAAQADRIMAVLDRTRQSLATAPSTLANP